MKKILFFSFCYPYGHFGPSDNCTVRIMEALVQTGKYEVWNLSYKPASEDSIPNYKIVDGIKLLFLPFSENRKHHSYIIEHLLLFLKIPIYPLYEPFRIWKHYKASRKILKDKHFDLVISQCAPQESVISGALLKRNASINKLLVLFWDNIYGKFPRRVVPKWFAIYRSRMVENWIAHYADNLVSPSPTKKFHEEYGEVREAVGKRIYLEHPAIIPPHIKERASMETFIKTGKINILYAGRVYFKEHLAYCMNLLGKTSFAEQMNVILLTRGISESDLKDCIKNFRGDVVLSGWIPVDELSTLYSLTDLCISFSGYSSSSVSSKVYEFMCYGKPIVYFYEDEGDVTKSAISRYPLSMSIGVKQDPNKFCLIMEKFIKDCMGRRVVYEEVEKLFPDATGTAYVKMISEMIE